MIFNWEAGRQGGGYEKMKLFESRRFKFDLYLLRYREGSEVKPHTDPAKNGYKHFRLNLILKEAEEGGRFLISPPMLVEKVGLNFRRLKLFRPDIQKHAVTQVLKGTRLVLSLGWLRKIPARNLIPDYCERKTF